MVQVCAHILVPSRSTVCGQIATRTGGQTGVKAPGYSGFATGATACITAWSRTCWHTGCEVQHRTYADTLSRIVVVGGTGMAFATECGVA